ncbi:MAG: lysophospholipid acyltransferase family protein [Acidobacteriota bacterium]
MSGAIEEGRVAKKAAGGWQVALASFAVAWSLRLLGWTVRTRYEGAERQRRWEREGSQFILAFWHRHLLMMPKLYRGRTVSIMISQHQDGEIAARAVRRLGVESTRGSSTRGGVGALKALVRQAKQGYDLGWAADGPKGPAQEAKAGVVAGARLTGLPILPVAFSATRRSVLEKSWDKMLIPWPFSTLWYVVGEPVWVTAEDDQEVARRRVEEALRAVSRRAEELAGHGSGGRPENHREGESP